MMQDANTREELKQQTIRLQEQLSSLLFSDEPVAKSGSPPPALDPTSASGVAAKLFEMAKSQPAATKAAPTAKDAPSSNVSYLDTEEVKIPSWLEPLARNAAAPASTQELIEREKAKHAAEIAEAEEHPADPLPIAEVEKAPEIELPGIGNLLPLDEEVTFTDRPVRRLQERNVDRSYRRSCLGRRGRCMVCHAADERGARYFSAIF